MQGQFGIPKLTNGHEREVNGGLNFVKRVWTNYGSRLFKRPFSKAPSAYEAIFPFSKEAELLRSERPTSLCATIVIRPYLLSPFLKFDWVWWILNGAHEISVPITVLLDAVELFFPLGTERALQAILLTHSQGPRGEKRPWFVCPTCHRRVEVLYHKNGLPFRCRKCCGLAYPTQYQSRNRSYGRWYRFINQRERERLGMSCLPCLHQRKEWFRGMVGLCIVSFLSQTKDQTASDTHNDFDSNRLKFA